MYVHHPTSPSAKFGSRVCFFASLQLLHVNKPRLLTVQPLARVKTNGTVIIYYKYNLNNILFFICLSIYPDLKRKRIIVYNHSSTYVSQNYTIL